MRKLAIFCEGLTEQLFAERLAMVIAGPGADIVKLKGCGKRGKRSLIRISTVPKDSRSKFYIQILDCGSDGNVASDVRDQYDALVDPGRGRFDAIIAMRDVYPNGRADIPSLLVNFKRFIRTKPIVVSFILAVMEIEAWFLAEHTHFSRISAEIDPDRIQRDLGFDPRTEDMSDRVHPAHDLHSCYQLGGMVYEKRAEVIARTVNALDADHMYLELGQRYRSLQELNDAITRFLVL